MLRLRHIDPAVLDFDCECRPLAWYGGDQVTKQITAIAWRFIGEFDVGTEVAYIGRSDRSSRVIDEEIEMLEAFREVYEDADVVTGHYIRGFDLPLLQGSMMRLGLPLLGPKLAQDTKNDLVAAQGISKSQENLGAMYELEHPKIGMNTSLWAKGNMLLPEGIEATVKRVMGDVDQHIELRREMLYHGHLGAPRLYTGHDGTEPGYTP
jgi:DNA polymerase elongation subunit (family B)